MTEYIIRYQKLGQDKVHKKVVKTSNITHLVGILGKHGYHVINYCENDTCNIFMVNTGRK